ncbi:MAG TPA: glycosyltransferase family 2 protein [Candidatus Bathyarchaeia archaeon]|nr:glycosyltransferase family 2 protein [Candidatus Bathyarchaeia archaeon]
MQGHSRVLLLTTMNEVTGLRSIWNNIPFHLFKRTVVVDAHSTDGTLDFLKDKQCEVIFQHSPGRGDAIREAMGQITENVVLLMASDGNDDPKYIPAFLAKIEEGYDIVSGSRFAPGGLTDDSDDPYRIRVFGNRLFTLLVNVLWNAQYSDAAYSLRAFRTDAWNKMNMNSKWNETEFLMSIRSAKLGLRVIQIPVIEGRRAGGEVKAKTFSTGWSLLKVLMRESIKS